MILTNDSFWADDFGILFKMNKITEIIPLQRMNTVEKLNAILRLSIYYTVIHYCYYKSTNILFIPVAVSVMTYIFFTNNVKEPVKERLSNQHKENNKNILFESVQGPNPNYNFNYRSNDKYEDNDCTLPTVDNPFGNVLLGDIKPGFNPTCTSYNNNMVKSDIKKGFEDNLFMDVNDVYSKHNSQRQFYTMPNTDVCNKQTEFAKWCYMTPPTCKEGNGLQCSANLSPPNGLNVDNLLSSQ